MRRTLYIAVAAFILTFGAGGCSEKDDIGAESEKDTGIAGIALDMESTGAIAEVGTKATVSGYSVNTVNDPTWQNIGSRTTWKLDFTLYNESVVYSAGSFIGGTYDTDNQYWKSTEQRYFPNYINPKADFLLYPDAEDTTAVKKDQSLAGGGDLLAQDILIKKQESIKIAHQIIQNTDNQAIALNHKRAMLDFIIDDVVTDDIESVRVLVGNEEYNPYQVNATAPEYMLILPENTSTDPVVRIVTKDNSAAGAGKITYRQTIDLTNDGSTTLGSNRCYYFTLRGNLLEISPVTVINWKTGEPVTGEYIAVTAYPTFKAEGYAGETYYLYYDNKLTNSEGTPRLQAITFNDNGECTVKADGRIITHIGEIDDYDQLKELTEPITLDGMLIDLTATINSLFFP